MTLKFELVESLSRRATTIRTNKVVNSRHLKRENRNQKFKLKTENQAEEGLEIHVPNHLNIRKSIVLLVEQQL